MFTFVSRWLGTQTKSRQRRQQHAWLQAQPLCLEVLEDRTLLTANLVMDINPGVASSQLFGFVPFHGSMLFWADDGTHGFELWKSDGTAAGTGLVKDVFPGSGSSFPTFFSGNFAVVNGTLFFVANDGVTGRELWKSDGTAAGTNLIKDIVPGSASSIPPNPWLTDVNGTLFFSATDNSGGVELWKSDGTAAGTVLVKDIFPGTAGSTPGPITNVNGMAFFSANDGTNGRELWTSDGTAAGTVLVKDIRPGNASSNLSSAININGMVVLRADDGISGQELWRSDGTAAGTILVKDIFVGGTGSDLGSFKNVNGTLFFRANDGIGGDELWRSDGTEAGTVLVKDIWPGSNGSFPTDMAVVNGTLLFNVQDDGATGMELWRSDGTAAGTTLVQDIFTGTDGSASNPVEVGGVAFLIADDGIHGEELWQSDGTAAGTFLVEDIYPGIGTSGVQRLTNVNGTLFFVADDGTTGIELWRAEPEQSFTPASLSGIAFADFNNNGEVDFNENGIAGVTVTLTGIDDFGSAVMLTQTTDADGAYVFAELRPGHYHLNETQPAGFSQGINTPGTLGGSVSAVDQFFLELTQGQDGFNYNFGERPAAAGAVHPGQTAGIGFWNNKNGQALIKSLNGGESSTQLGNWLAATFGNLYGQTAGASNQTGKTNAEVAAFFQSTFKVKGQKLASQVLASALAVYVTNQSLAGNSAVAYGFLVTEYGLGISTFNVGSHGAAFDVGNNTVVTVMDILMATNRKSTNGILYYDPNAAVMQTQRNLANALYSDLNQVGDIG